MSQLNYALAAAATVAVGVLAYYFLKPKGKKIPLKQVELTVRNSLRQSFVCAINAEGA